MPTPNTIPYLKYQDIQIPDNLLQQQLQQYFQNGQYTEALTLLSNNNLQLEGKAYIANTINTLINGVMTLENYYYQGVTVFLSNLANQYQTMINNLRKRGTWTNSIQYTPYNFVVYNNNIYMCILQPPVGTPPTNTTYWLYLGLRGIQGPPGINVVMEYAWDSDVTYQVNDLVTYDGNIYVALQENTKVLPGTDPSTWMLFIQIETGGIIISVDTPSITVNNSIWFKPQSDPSQATSTTPIIGQFYRYVADSKAWDPMYPNTVFNWVINYGDYAQPVFIDQVTIATSAWQNKTWTYTYPTLTEQSLVDVIPNGALSTAQKSLYNGLSIAISGTTITLTSATTPTVSLPIQIRIIQ